MAGPTTTRATMNQQLPELVEWFLQDQGIELRFVPNQKMTGKLAPEFDFEFWHMGRRISERCLAMLINCELSRKNYNYMLSKIISALTEQAWRYYLHEQEYPDWLRKETPTLKRPRGRPRKHAPKIDLPAPPAGKYEITEDEE